ncbi:Vms1/Ankzf1 family peptidyl-tRNA hydrolase [Dactylosporangium sp. NPDC051485]|uniref:baeRF2 domain-containing protein n=1 Tax=Dactylosporangium sp. NPDC051485 TaxID=3154846 RepID=UPI00343A5024
MDVSFLRPLYERPGRWASVYLDGTRQREDVTAAVELRWRNARTGLERAGCDRATADALGAALLAERGREGPRGVAGFACAGRVELMRVLDGPPRRQIAVFEPLPHAMPLLAQLGEGIPYVRVLLDRTGGDVEAVGTGRVVHRESVAGGEVFPMHRSKPGGWSAPRYQRAAHVTWQRNAGDVAAAVAEAAWQCGAEVIVVAGDPQARPMLVAKLPEHWQERVVQTTEGARAPGADLAALDDATAEAVAERAAEAATGVLDRYHSHRGTGGAAADGLPAVVHALQRGQADTVLIADDPSATGRVWIGPEPLQLSFDRAELEGMGVPAPQRARADAALVRAIVGSDAHLLFVAPDDLPGDISVATLLRYADTTTRHR